jgi:hypothetical protein
MPFASCVEGNIRKERIMKHKREAEPKPKGKPRGKGKGEGYGKKHTVGVEKYSVSGLKLREIRSILANAVFLLIDPDKFPASSVLRFRHVNAMRDKGIRIQVLGPPDYTRLRRIGRHSLQNQRGPGREGGGGRLFASGPSNKPAWTDDRWHDDVYYIADDALLKHLKRVPTQPDCTRHYSEPEPKTKAERKQKACRPECVTQ